MTDDYSDDPPPPESSRRSPKTPSREQSNPSSRDHLKHHLENNLTKSSRRITKTPSREPSNQSV